MYSPGQVFRLREPIRFLEIGLDADHARFLAQSLPACSPASVVQRIKSVTAREVFSLASEVEDQLWGGEFWGKGRFVNTVGQHGREEVIAAYVRGQGGKSDYRELHRGQMDFGLY